MIPVLLDTLQSSRDEKEYLFYNLLHFQFLSAALVEGVEIMVIIVDQLIVSSSASNVPGPPGWTPIC